VIFRRRLDEIDKAPRTGRLVVEFLGAKLGCLTGFPGGIFRVLIKLYTILTFSKPSERASDSELS
jgi:hypothetical protein